MDILRAELIYFDLIALSETWLGDQTNSDDIQFQNFKNPERKDRVGDRHGGVIVYIRDSLFHKRRLDLEIANIESIWIEVVSNKKHFLFGVFYRPPNSNALYNNSIEDSIQLAIDTGIISVALVIHFYHRKPVIIALYMVSSNLLNLNLSHSNVKYGNMNLATMIYYVGTVWQLIGMT